MIILKVSYLEAMSDQLNKQSVGLTFKIAAGNHLGNSLIPILPISSHS